MPAPRDVTGLHHKHTRGTDGAPRRRGERSNGLTGSFAPLSSSPLVHDSVHELEEQTRRRDERERDRTQTMGYTR